MSRDPWDAYASAVHWGDTRNASSTARAALDAIKPGDPFAGNHRKPNRAARHRKPNRRRNITRTAAATLLLVAAALTVTTAAVHHPPAFGGVPARQVVKAYTP
jgi:hypothetical protein